MDRPAGVWCLLVLAFLAVVTAQGDISCKDDWGNDVDWYVGHKFPKLNPAPGPNRPPSTLPLGTTYQFMNPLLNRWEVSQFGIDNQNSMIGRTLLQASWPVIITMGHNDQPPIGSASHTYAHSKGVILVNGYTGNAVWLSHSVPKFPDIRGLLQNVYQYAPERMRNGQSFLCVNLNRNQLDTLGQHLYRMRAFSYDTQPANLAPWLQNHAPWLFLVSQRDFRQLAPRAPFSITSRAGWTVRLFSKESTDRRDIWSQIVAPELRANMYVQSWLCGSGNNLPWESGAGYITDNAGYIYIPWNIQRGTPLGYQNWYSGPTKDHSKFAISSRNRGDFVCIGDMNRKSTQLDRGGGAACIGSTALWREYFRMMTNNAAPNPQAPTAADLQCLP